MIGACEALGTGFILSDVKKVSILLLLIFGCSVVWSEILHANDFFITKGDTVHRVGADGTSSAFASLPDGASGLAFNANGVLYVKGATDTIYSIDTNRNVTTFVQSPLVNGSGALAFDSSGNLYGANSGSTNVIKITPLGEVSVFADRSLFGNNVVHMAGLAFDSLNNLYVSTWDDNSILKINQSGISSTFYQGSNSVVTAGLAFDTLGNLFVANFLGSLVKITPEGNASTFSVGAPLAGPWGLTSDSNNNFYAANYSSSGSDALIQMTSEGVASVYASGIGGGGGGLTYVATVPEPSTYALLLLSGAASLWALKRRKS